MKYWRALSITVLFAGSLSGCTTSATVAPLQPSNKMLRDTIGTSPGPVFYPDRMTASDRAILKEALSEVTTLLDSSEFEQSLSSKTWRAGCLSDVRVTGAMILDDLKTNTIPVPLRKKNSSGANATTNIKKRWMRIDNDRFDNWNLSNQHKAAMINTLIHEITHLVPYDKVTPPNQNWYYKYYDQGHNSNGCYDADLVSYQVGNIAEKVWLESKGELASG